MKIAKKNEDDKNKANAEQNKGTIDVELETGLLFHPMNWTNQKKATAWRQDSQTESCCRRRQIWMFPWYWRHKQCLRYNRCYTLKCVLKWMRQRNRMNCIKPRKHVSYLFRLIDTKENSETILRIKQVSTYCAAVTSSTMLPDEYKEAIRVLSSQTYHFCTCSSSEDVTSRKWQPTYLSRSNDTANAEQEHAALRRLDIKMKITLLHY